MRWRFIEKEEMEDRRAGGWQERRGRKLHESKTESRGTQKWDARWQSGMNNGKKRECLIVKYGMRISLSSTEGLNSPVDLASVWVSLILPFSRKPPSTRQWISPIMQKTQFLYFGRKTKINERFHKGGNVTFGQSDRWKNNCVHMCAWPFL